MKKCCFARLSKIQDDPDLEIHSRRSFIVLVRCALRIIATVEFRWRGFLIFNFATCIPVNLLISPLVPLARMY
jgi:hypothetical protein